MKNIDYSKINFDLREYSMNLLSDLAYNDDTDLIYNELHSNVFSELYYRSIP
jgi:hypothetical protein